MKLEKIAYDLVDKYVQQENEKIRRMRKYNLTPDEYTDLTRIGDQRLENAMRIGDLSDVKKRDASFLGNMSGVDALDAAIPTATGMLLTKMLFGNSDPITKRLFYGLDLGMGVGRFATNTAKRMNDHERFNELLDKAKKASGTQVVAI